MHNNTACFYSFRSTGHCLHVPLVSTISMNCLNATQFVWIPIKFNDLKWTVLNILGHILDNGILFICESEVVFILQVVSCVDLFILLYHTASSHFAKLYLETWGYGNTAISVLLASKRNGCTRRAGGGSSVMASSRPWHVTLPLCAPCQVTASSLRRTASCDSSSAKLSSTSSNCESSSLSLHQTLVWGRHVIGPWHWTAASLLLDSHHLFAGSQHLVLEHHGAPARMDPITPVTGILILSLLQSLGGHRLKFRFKNTLF